MKNLLLVAAFFGLIQLVNAEIKTLQQSKDCGSVICD